MNKVMDILKCVSLTIGALGAVCLGLAIVCAPLALSAWLGKLCWNYLGKSFWPAYTIKFWHALAAVALLAIVLRGFKVIVNRPLVRR